MPTGTSTAPWPQAGRARGISIHAVSLYATEQAALEAFSATGFGRIMLDAARPTLQLRQELGGETARGCSVRRAVPADAQALAELNGALADHIAAAPVLLPGGQGPGCLGLAGLARDPRGGRTRCRRRRRVDGLSQGRRPPGGCLRCRARSDNPGHQRHVPPAGAARPGDGPRPPGGPGRSCGAAGPGPSLRGLRDHEPRGLRLPGPGCSGPSPGAWSAAPEQPQRRERAASRPLPPAATGQCTIRQVRIFSPACLAVSRTFWRDAVLEPTWLLKLDWDPAVTAPPWITRSPVSVISLARELK